MAVAAALAIGALAWPALGTSGQDVPPTGYKTLLRKMMDDPTPLLLIGTGLIVVVLVMFQRYRALKAQDPPALEERFARIVAERAARAQSGADATGAAASAGLATSGRPRSVPASRTPPQAPEPTQITELRTVMADAEELADRLSRALDAQAERLEALMRQADDYLRRVEATKRHSVVEARPTSTAPVGAARQRPSISLEDDSDPLHRQVYELADAGATPLDIARRLNQPTGQVELILALRPR